ncbi:membrane-bound O-acyltransferase domain-containing protein 2 [Aplysia californica]|uniref:Membrane-bound O-acyltransferase domain-containing protein 2 n=1 Tax=Aplysia californica TaxID=6500 RepID=A0ABM0JTX5_APLCA|nr:membrane-bound O-acyltransferase domain-containing protein 2 [Aplysia californica]
MAFKSEFYGGSRILTPVADTIGLPIDQINFLVCQLVALGFAFPFRSLFSVEKVGAQTRHIIEAVVGVLLTLFCFGYQIWHLLVQSLVSYAFMAYGGSRFSHAFVFVFSMLYLSVCHIYRQVYDYGGYTLDITGPLMIQTQKLTSLAFALHDGRYKEEAKLSQDQKQHAVRKLPNVVQYLSFMFYFHGVMVGPLTFYNDYIAFIDGTHFKKPGGSSTNAGSKKHPADDLNRVVIKKLVVASACCLGMMILPGLFFPPEKLNTPEYYNMTFMERMIFVLGVMTLARNKYYFAWVLADAINNAAGLGFSGYDSQGNPKWDLTDNVDILGVELSTSLKVNIDSWNKKTLIWLRRVVYDRAPPSNNTLAVFACSAFWHGFYPGYYLTFGGGAFMTVVARQVRRKVRPWFQTSPTKIQVYDVITFIATRFTNCYLCFPFLVLEFYSCYFMYKSLYFYLHIMTAMAYVLFTFLPTAKQGSASAASTRPSSRSGGAGSPPVSNGVSSAEQIPVNDGQSASPSTAPPTAPPTPAPGSDQTPEAAPIVEREKVE